MGVIDSKLSAAINETCGIKCSHVGVVPEVNSIIYFVSVLKQWIVWSVACIVLMNLYF